MRVPDFKVSKIEEERVIHRYRISKSVLSPYPEGKEKAGIMLVSLRFPERYYGIVRQRIRGDAPKS